MNDIKWFWLNILMLIILVISGCILVYKRFNTRYSYNYLAHLKTTNIELNNQYFRILAKKNTYDIANTLEEKPNAMIVPPANKIMIVK